MGIQAQDRQSLPIIVLCHLNQIFCVVAADHPLSLFGQVAQSQSGTTGDLKNVFPLREIRCKAVPVKHPLQLLLGHLVSRNFRNGVYNQFPWDSPRYP